MTETSRIIESQDLITARFYDIADEWAVLRKIERFSSYKIRDSFNEASSISDIQNGDKVMVTWADQGTHISTIGDVGAVSGNTPNSGYYVYNSGLQKLVRTAPLEPEIAKGFSDLTTTNSELVAETADYITTTKTDIDSKYTSIISTNTNINSKATQVSADKTTVEQLKAETLIIRNEAVGFGGGKIKATYAEAVATSGLTNGDIIAVLSSDTGTHASVSGDIGASGGQTPNSGYYKYSSSLTALVRVDSISSVVARDAADRATLQAYLSSNPFNNLTSLNSYTNAFLAIGDRTTIIGDGVYSLSSLSPVNWVRVGDSADKISSTAALTAVTSVGSINPAQILSIDNSVSVPNAPSFRTTANRLKRIGRCNWAKCSTNEARIYTDNNGAISGVLFAGGETIKSADWFTAPPDSSAGQYVTLFSGTGAVVQQVGSHTSADIAGGVGKLARIYGGTSGTVTIRAPNLKQAVISGDKLRVGILVSFDNPATAISLVMSVNTASGSGVTGNIPIQVAVDGTVTITAATTRGIDLFDTDANGRKWYRIWADYTSTGTGEFYPAMTLPAGAYVNFMAWTVKNPTQEIPSVVPVMGDGVFAADSIQLGTDTPVEVEWTNLRVGRTSVSNGVLTPPRNKATPVLELEKKITVKKATEITGRAYALPSPRMALLFVGGMTDYLGPGNWGITPNLTTGSYIIQSAYMNPKRWAILRRMRISNAAITSLTLSNVAIWLRCPYGSSTGSTADSQYLLSVEIDPAKVTLGDLLLVGASGEWSQYYSPISYDSPPSWIGRNLGRFYIAPGNYSGTLVMGKIKSTRVNYGLVTNINSSYTVTLSSAGFASDKPTADHIQIGGAGTSALVFDHHVFGEFEAQPANFWQTSYEIEVDTGSGWTTLSASGLTYASLPLWKRFSWYGTHIGGTITAGPKPERQLWINSWEYGSGLGTSINKAGFQYRGPNMVYRDPITDVELYRTQAIPDGSVWISDNVGVPTTSDPRIRIRHTSVKWTSTSVNVPQSGPLSAGAGSHGDNMQVLGNAIWSYNCQNAVMIGTGAGGFFISSSSVCTSFNTRGIYMLNTVNALGIHGTGTYTISGIMAAPYSPDRDYYGRQYMPRIDVNTGSTLDLSGLYVTTNSDSPSPMRTVTGTLSGSPIPVAEARISGNTLISSTTDQPTATNFLEYFIPASSLKDGKVNANPSTLTFSGYALEKIPSLKGILEKVRLGAWGMFSELEEICKLGSPTHFTNISNTAPIGTALTLIARNPLDTPVLKGKLIIDGDSLEQFVLENGVLKTNALLKDAYGTALVDNYALVTDAGERISVKFTV